MATKWSTVIGPYRGWEYRRLEKLKGSTHQHLWMAKKTCLIFRSIPVFVFVQVTSHCLERTPENPRRRGEFVPAMSRMCGETEVAFMGIHGDSSYCTMLIVSKVLISRLSWI